jgi:hypothetical protein
MELELDPSRLPRGFPFRTVPELEEFFSSVEGALEGAGPGGLPAGARETMARWFPELAAFLEEHAGGGGAGGGGRGEEEGEGAGAAGAAAAAAAAAAGAAGEAAEGEAAAEGGAAAEGEEEEVERS